MAGRRWSSHCNTFLRSSRRRRACRTEHDERTETVIESPRHSIRAANVDTGNVYERTRAGFVATLAAHGATDLSISVPATPDWTVHDVVAHVVGLAADLNAQRFPEPDDPGGNRWSAAQVTARRSATLPELLAEWDREAPTFAAGLEAFGYEWGSHFAADLYTHHLDVEHLWRQTRGRDHLTTMVALDHYLGFVDELLDEHQWGRLSVHVDDETYRLGSTTGGNDAELHTTSFEALRTFSARRSARQIAALDWRGDADAFIAWFADALPGGYSIPITGIHE